jgi:hypothetical protein
MPSKNKPGTIHGVLSGIRSIAARTRRTFVLCNIGKQKCKLFGELADHILANQHEYEGREAEAHGYWEVNRENEFIIEGINQKGVQTTADVRPKPGSETRPEKPSIEVRDKYVVITIPQGATPEQLHKITDVAKEAVRGLETQVGNGITELANVSIRSTDPAEETDEILF